MKKFSVIALVAIGLMGCNSATTSQTTTQDSTPAPAPAPQQSAPPAQPAAVAQSAIVENAVDLTFIDIAGFDEDLSMGMSTKNRKIVVDLPGRVSLNDVPGRLDQWFSEIKNSGGSVKAKPLTKKNATATRGIAGMLIDIGVKAHKAYAHEQMLKPAQDYHVLLEYDKDTGIVERAVFYHR